MDFIERAAQRLAQDGSRPAIRKDQKPRVVEPLHSSDRKPSPRAPDQKPRLVNYQGPHSLVDPTDRRPRNYIKIDSKHLDAFRDILLENGRRTQVAEAFRQIKRQVINYEAADNIEPSNILLVTSAKPNEGKTHIALNLAMSIALERDLTVLLVDADLAQPDVTRRLGIKPDRGLYDFLDDPSIDLSDIQLDTNVDRLSVIPAGRLQIMSTELLASSRMKEFVQKVANNHPGRVVIFDGPSLLATTEAGVLTKHAGQVLLTVEAGKTTHTEIRLALELIDGHPKTGFILNKASPQVGTFRAGYYDH